MMNESLVSVKATFLVSILHCSVPSSGFLSGFLSLYLLTCTLSKICPLYLLSAENAKVIGKVESAEPGLLQLQGRGHGLHRVRVVAEVGLVGEVGPGVDRVVAEGEH